MSKWIDADALIKENAYASDMWDRETQSFDLPIVEVSDIENAPSIDIVRCKECRWIRYCETEDLDVYLDCDKPDGGGIPRNEDWFCADGEREGE